MSNTKNSGFVAITNGKDTFPLSASGTGTVDTVGKMVIGTSTLFTTEAKVGGYLFDASADEIRRIDKITSNTSMSLVEAFSSDLSSATPAYVPPSEYVEISVFIPPAEAAGEIDGTALPPGVGVGWGKTGRTTSADRDKIEPIIVDATGTVVYIQSLK